MLPSQLTEINGKKLKQPQKNLLSKLESLGLTFPQTSQLHANPFSGAVLTLDPIPSGLVTFILTQYNGGRPLCGIQIWDRARYFLLEFYPEAYNTFVD